MSKIKFGMMAFYQHYDGNLEKMISDAAKNGVDSLMLHVCVDDKLKKKILSEAEEIKGYCTKYGVEINAIWAAWDGPTYWDLDCGFNTLGLIPVEYRDRRMQEILNASEVAEAFGVKYVVTHCGYIPENPFDPTYRSFVAMMKYVCTILKNRGQWFCFETGQETPLTLVRAIEDIGIGNLGINLDTSNLITYGKADPVNAIKVFGKYVKCLHLKDGRWSDDTKKGGPMVAIGEGDVDFPAVIKGLYEHGYRGHFTIERELDDSEERNKEIIKTRDLIINLTSKYEWDPE